MMTKDEKEEPGQKKRAGLALALEVGIEAIMAGGALLWGWLKKGDDDD